jgi:hypothetical protein
MNKKVHAEIQYRKANGDVIHSDICPPECEAANLTDQGYRELLHTCLDEWLDNSNGTEFFYIAEKGTLLEKATLELKESE